MIDFPESAAFGRKIPFAGLQKQGVPRRFGAIETAIYPKVSGGVLYGDSAVFRYARSASDLQMPSREIDYAVA